jgi:hypothetical protein
VGNATALKVLESFIKAESSLELDGAGHIDLTKTNRERLSTVSASVLVELERIKTAIGTEVQSNNQQQQPTTTAPSSTKKRDRSNNDNTSNANKSAKKSKTERRSS